MLTVFKAAQGSFAVTATDILKRMPSANLQSITLLLGSVTKWDNKPHLGSWAAQQWDLYLESMTPLNKQLFLLMVPGILTTVFKPLLDPR